MKKTLQEVKDQERRKFKRFDAYMSVKFHSSIDHGITGVSLSKDLCRDGIRINAEKPIDEDTMLDLEITIPDDPKPIVTAGRVMWSRLSAGENQGYDHGVQLLNMDPVDKFRVLDYAYNHWLETKINDFSEPEDFREIG